MPLPATLILGLILLLLGALLLWSGPVVVVTARRLPRSRRAAVVFFGAAALGFLWVVGHMSAADRIAGSSNAPWVAGFALLGALAFYCVPDFLGVRGLSILALLLTWRVLYAETFMRYDGALLGVKATAYLVAAAALYFAAVPYRLRDFIEWLFSTAPRPRWMGALLAALGLLVVVAAFRFGA